MIELENSYHFRGHWSLSNEHEKSLDNNPIAVLMTMTLITNHRNDNNRIRSVRLSKASSEMDFR